MAAGAVSAPLIIPMMHLETHRAKNMVDTHTPVSMQSDTPDVQVFFTLDGSRPVPGQRGPAGSSRKYSAPVLLPAGRVVVRAVAVTSDGRESSIVSKVFSVELVKENEDQQPPAAPRFLNRRFGSPTRPPRTGSPPRLQSEGAGVGKQLSGVQASRIHRETDLLRCAQCLSFRPLDPFARFCSQCGAAVPPLPEQRPSPAEGGQVFCCVFCSALVPANTHTCLICEASVRPQLPQHVVCVCCGAGNPAHISSCLTCESRLQPVVCVGTTPPSKRMLTCSRCNRLNRSDARYCDWCGSKPGQAARCVVCQRCGASGHPYASYCAACGVFQEAPPTSCCDITPPGGGAATDQSSAPTSHDATWQPVPVSGPGANAKLATAEQATQTTGLYYPSATELRRKEQQQQQQVNRQQAARERPPLLTAISPGRGYWRKQLDHVCAHLRSHAQNNGAFRALLGEPRMGRVVSAVIQEDRHEVSVTVSFVSAAREEPQVGPQVGPAADGVGPAADGVGPAGRTETLSSVTEGSAGSDRSTALMKPPKRNLTPKPPVKDVQLLAELGPGRGQISVVQQLLDQGADPSCCAADGRHALAVAVVNGHHDVLPVLVQRGADVNQQSGPMKNTALHDAAALGSDGLQCARVLLSCQAGVRRRNASEQTAYDVAVNAGCNDMVSLLAARTGLDLLGRLGPLGRPGPLGRLGPLGKLGKLNLDAI